MHINIEAHMTKIGWSARMFIEESEELVTPRVGLGGAWGRDV
jgi:hypothetical protein